MKKYVAHCDGSISGGNPGGWAVGGWVLRNDESCEVVQYGCVDLGKNEHNTNNMAEYAAVYGVMWWAYLHTPPTSRIDVFSDSRLVVMQLKQLWQCNRAQLIRFRDSIWSLTKKFEVSYNWLPRNENKDADAVSRLLYGDKIVEPWTAEESYTIPLCA